MSQSPYYVYAEDNTLDEVNWALELPWIGGDVSATELGFVNDPLASLNEPVSRTIEAVCR